MGTTPNYKWTLPTVHSDATTWGGELNTTLGAIDAVVWNIEKVELAAIQGQVTPNSVTISRTATVPAVYWLNNSTAPAGQQARWVISESTEAESGGDVGSNLVIQSYTDAGAFKGIPAEFLRSNGGVIFNYTVNVQGAFSAASTVSVAGAMTVTGPVNANGGVNINGTLDVNGNILGSIHYFAWPTYSDFVASGNASIKFIQWTTNYLDEFNVSSGLRSWVAAGTTVMTLDGGGALTVTGSFGASGSITSGSSISAVGNVTAGSTVTANGGTVVAKAAGGGNAQFVMENNAGTAVGYCFWDAPSNSVILTFPSFSNSFQLVTSGDCYANPGSAGHNFVVTQGGALKPGGGSWGTWSDARIKSVRGDYTAGLEAILQLRPVTYAYKGDYAKSGDGKEFIGLVADEAMKVLPEMVSLQKGTIDGREVDDLKVLDTSALVFALINAVKELKAEIEALKAMK